MTIYEILAGEGLAGAIVLAVVGIVWAIIRPHLYTWLADKKLEKLLLAVETAVAAGKQKYTDDWKAASANGKLTAEQGAQIMAECRAYIIQFLKSQGVDALKEYGPSIIDSLCEAKLAELKESSLKKKCLTPVRVARREAGKFLFVNKLRWKTGELKVTPSGIKVDDKTTGTIIKVGAISKEMGAKAPTSLPGLKKQLTTRPTLGVWFSKSF